MTVLLNASSLISHKAGKSIDVEAYRSLETLLIHKTKHHSDFFTDPSGGNSLLAEWFGSYLWLGATMGINSLNDTASGINSLF